MKPRNTYDRLMQAHSDALAKEIGERVIAGIKDAFKSLLKRIWRIGR